MILGPSVSSSNQGWYLYCQFLLTCTFTIYKSNQFVLLMLVPSSLAVTQWTILLFELNELFCILCRYFTSGWTERTGPSTCSPRTSSPQSSATSSLSTCSTRSTSFPRSVYRAARMCVCPKSMFYSLQTWFSKQIVGNVLGDNLGVSRNPFLSHKHKNLHEKSCLLFAMRILFLHTSLPSLALSLSRWKSDQLVCKNVLSSH